MMLITKPKHRMKKVTEQLARCIANECKGCYLQKEPDCMRSLIWDANYYLQMALEKSEKGQNDVPKMD